MEIIFPVADQLIGKSENRKENKKLTGKFLIIPHHFIHDG
jgi:hypothetical protein